MDKTQIPPLQTLTLRPAPLNLHCLSWSSDAELAVAVDDCIHVFLPSFPSIRRPGDGPSSAGGVPPPQYSLTLRISTKIRPEPAINRQLFAFSGSVELPQTGDESALTPLGQGPVTGSGAAMFQVVRVEWSPAGLGCNLRPILLALLTTGMLVAFGEHVDENEAGLRSRTIKMWKILWGLGGTLPIPDSEEEAGYRFMDERITSFSWAKEIAAGRALLAYRNDEGDVAIMSVQFHTRPKPGDSKLTDGWDVQEVARFRANGPHADVDELDPNFIPSGSAFSLKWSPWVIDGQTRTATLAYVAPNYVGFRRVTISADWVRGQAPEVEVEAADTVATCLSLSSDAFIEWEDAIWTEDDGRQIARGYIGTPLQVKAFEVPMTGALQPPVSDHSTADCDTAYGTEDESTNPIVGIVIHPPKPTSKPPLPLYTLARLSATGANKDWYETNLPDEHSALPSWVERIRKNSTMLVSRARIMGGAEPESESEDIDEGQSEAEDVPEKLENPFRFRIWGMASSPGGLSTTVVVSKYSSLYPQRRGVCHVYFGRERLTMNQDAAGLTTEGKMWEWMYADGPPVPAVTVADKVKIEDEPSSSGSKLRQVFSGVLHKQVCVFCDGKLNLVGDSALCENGHAWAACVATGLAIMEPGITHVCAVCGMRCLRRSALETLAAQHLGPDVMIPQGSAACEGCGGKFVV